MSDFGEELANFLDSTDDEVEPAAAQAPEEIITGFKISAHGGFIYEDMLDEGFRYYTNNQKTFIVKVRSEFGGTTLTRQCSTQIEETCEGAKCNLGDDATYVKYLQIVCGTNNDGNVGLYSTIPYKPNGEISTTNSVPDLQLSSTKDDTFYYGYIIYYDNDDGRENRERNLSRFNDFNNYEGEKGEEITYLSTEIINFYNIVKDSSRKNFDVKVAACLVLADENLEISCMQKYKKIKADEEINFAGWFNCFQNFVDYKCDQSVIDLFLNEKIHTLNDLQKYYDLGLLTDEEHIDYLIKFARKYKSAQAPAPAGRDPYQDFIDTLSPSDKGKFIQHIQEQQRQVAPTESRKRSGDEFDDESGDESGDESRSGRVKRKRFNQSAHGKKKKKQQTKKRKPFKKKQQTKKHKPSKKKRQTKQKKKSKSKSKSKSK